MGDTVLAVWQCEVYQNDRRNKLCICVINQHVAKLAV